MIIKLRSFIVLVAVCLLVSCAMFNANISEVAGTYKMHVSRYRGLYYSPTAYNVYFYKDSVLLFESCRGLKKSKWYLQEGKVYFSGEDTSLITNPKLYKMDILRNGNLRRKNVRAVLSSDTSVVFYHHLLYKKINSAPPDSLLQQVNIVEE